MVTMITSHIFINISKTVHFSAVKFTRCNEKNMSFVLIPKFSEVWTKKSEAIGPGTFNCIFPHFHFQCTNNLSILYATINNTLFSSVSWQMSDAFARALYHHDHSQQESYKENRQTGRDSERVGRCSQARLKNMKNSVGLHQSLYLSCNVCYVCPVNMSVLLVGRTILRSLLFCFVLPLIVSLYFVIN